MKKRRSFSSNEETQNFWPSFTDMISTMMLILLFLVLIVVMKEIIIGNKFKDKELKIKQLNLQISEKQKDFIQLQRDVENLEGNFEKIQVEAEKGKEALKLSELEIEKQKEIIAKSNQELGNMRNKLQQMAVLRLDILNKVKEAIEGQLNTSDLGDNEVSIGENGNIILNNRVMFGPDSYVIKNEGKKLLNELSIVFEKVLDDEAIRENIDAINIQGHTDDIDTAEYNRTLSSKRAISVVNYLLLSNKQLESKYGKYFISSAYSEYRPIASGTSAQARAKNRRIEISITLKDSNIQKIIDSYLEQTNDLLKDESIKEQKEEARD